MGQAISQDPPDFVGDDSTPLPKDSFTLPLPLGSSCDWQPLHSGCFLSQSIGLSHGDRWKSVTQREAGSLKAALPSKLRNLSRPHVPGVLCSNGWLCQVAETLSGTEAVCRSPGQLAAMLASLEGSGPGQSHVLLGVFPGSLLFLSFLTLTPFLLWVRSQSL